MQRWEHLLHQAHNVAVEGHRPHRHGFQPGQQCAETEMSALAKRHVALGVRGPAGVLELLRNVPSHGLAIPASRVSGALPEIRQPGPQPHDDFGFQTRHASGLEALSHIAPAASCRPAKSGLVGVGPELALLQRLVMVGGCRRLRRPGGAFAHEIVRHRNLVGQ